MGLDRPVSSGPPADFTVAGRYTFEVGGKSKGGAQIRGIPDAYLAVDDTEIGTDRRVPLFGLLY